MFQVEGESDLELKKAKSYQVRTNDEKYVKHEESIKEVRENH